MFYLIDIEDHVRVEPQLFGLPVRKAIEQQLETRFLNYFDQEIGNIIKVVGIDKIGEGIIIPGDSAVYYYARFRVLSFKPILQEVAYGVVSQITNFGAFINLGIVEGLIHISQTMDDYVSFGKSNVLLGKSSKRSLKINDTCLARIIAISYKVRPAKIGLTMRQPGLGKLEWIQDEKRKQKPGKQSKTEKAKSKKTKHKK